MCGWSMGATSEVIVSQRIRKLCLPGNDGVALWISPKLCPGIHKTDEPPALSTRNPPCLSR